MDILVVDDTQVIREVLMDLLSPYNVQCCKDGSEALEILQTTSFKVLISDLKMPNLGGLELCRKLRKWNPMIYCIAMTGYPQVFEICQCREAGFDDYITKPFKMTI